MSAKNSLTLLESVEDNYRFERAWIAQEDGALVPRAVFGGIVCNIETKPGPLAAGLAWCEPIDGTPEESWPVYVRVELEGEEETLWKMTGNAHVVSAARRYQWLIDCGRARAGMTL